MVAPLGRNVPNKERHFNPKPFIDGIEGFEVAPVSVVPSASPPSLVPVLLGGVLASLVQHARAREATRQSELITTSALAGICVTKARRSREYRCSVVISASTKYQ